MSRSTRLTDQKARIQTGARQPGCLQAVFGCLRVTNFHLRFLFFVGLAAIVLLLMPAAPVFAQGCAMCYTTAAAAKAAAIRALRSGILVLLIPPVLMFIGIFVFAYSRREKFNEQTANDGVDEQELSDWLASMPQAEEGGDEETMSTGSQSAGSRERSSGAV